MDNQNSSIKLTRPQAARAIAMGVGNRDLDGYYYKRLLWMVKSGELTEIKNGRFWYFDQDEIDKVIQREKQIANVQWGAYAMLLMEVKYRNLLLIKETKNYI